MAALVSIAFRRLVRSRRLDFGEIILGRFSVSIAFRRLVRSRLHRAAAECPSRISLHCLSAFSAFPTWRRGAERLQMWLVSIAFRRLVRSRRREFPATAEQWDAGLHCLSAFSAFPTRRDDHRCGLEGRRLHCLSAFSAFPTWRPVMI